jgi:NAD(P)-dependent dehydrogenase (short-subunit alcohol dehydrogenase family)
MGLLDLFRLDGRVALITGGSAGLGAAFAQGCSEAGARVVIAARDATRAQTVAASLQARGHDVQARPVDVTDPASCQDLVAGVVADTGRLDILVNNAGVAAAAPATREEPDQFRAVLDVNLHGAYWMAQACGRVMPPGSSIVNISSVLAFTTQGLPQAAYSASKAGLLGLTRDLAQQWGARKGIRVNAIAPGFFETAGDRPQPDRFTAQAPRIVLGRKGDPRELAATLVWLVSAAGGYVSGQTVIVDGGYTIT